MVVILKLHLQQDEGPNSNPVYLPAESANKHEAIRYKDITTNRVGDGEPRNRYSFTNKRS